MIVTTMPSESKPMLHLISRNQTCRREDLLNHASETVVWSISGSEDVAADHAAHAYALMRQNTTDDSENGIPPIPTRMAT